VSAFAVVSAELPAVERTLETAGLHQSSDGQVGAVVAAVGVEHVCSTVVASKHRQVLTCVPTATSSSFDFRLGVVVASHQRKSLYIRRARLVMGWVTVFRQVYHQPVVQGMSSSRTTARLQHKNHFRFLLTQLLLLFYNLLSITCNPLRFQQPTPPVPDEVSS